MSDYLVICAWCGKTMRVVGNPPKDTPDVSHGMCEACAKRDIERYKHEHRSTAPPSR